MKTLTAPAGVFLKSGPDGGLGAMYRQARAASGSVDRALTFVAGLADSVPLPGAGQTLRLWETLATVAAADLTVARVLEPHLDAVAITTQAGVAAPGGSWGVFAAEAAGVQLEARYSGGQWTLRGTKPWCSLAGSLDRAVVTAHVHEGSARRAFMVDLRGPGVKATDGGWVSRGLSEVRSGPATFSDVPAVPLGANQWYLEREGFAWGAMGVAACWFGGAVGITRLMVRTAQQRRPDQIALMHLGRVDAALHQGQAVLCAAADAVDAGTARGMDGSFLAARVRSIVWRACEQVLESAAHALGPAPLAFDEEHARRVADLQIYLRQHHAERDDATLGGMVLGRGAAW